VDVMFLERAGYSVEVALPVALAKDGGCTPATLAWLLSEISIPEEVVLPAGVTPAELRRYVADLISRFLALAAPPYGCAQTRFLFAKSQFTTFQNASMNLGRALR